MAEIHRKALLAYPAQDVFKLINDVPRYPEFLRWCVDSHVLQQTDNEMLAGLTVSIGGFRQKFTTRNTAETTIEESGRPAHCLRMQLVEGPFQRLQGRWQVTALAENACQIELFLGFEFKAGLVQAAFSSGFGRVAEQLVSDFVNRAHQLYKNPQSS